MGRGRNSQILLVIRVTLRYGYGYAGNPPYSAYVLYLAFV